RDFEFGVVAGLVQRRLGGSRAGLFELVADTVEKRRQFRLRVRSLTAMVRLSALVLTLLPLFVTALITLFNYDYMKPLFTTTTGKVIIVSSVCMISIGFLVLRRMVASKV